MARQYVVTEEELLSLIESLELNKLRKTVEQGKTHDQVTSDMHRSFHFVVTRWVQSIGFKGYRG